MRRISLAKAPCPVARALDSVGDWWTLLIVRDALLGSDRFEQFARALPISRNALAQRLAALVDGGILVREVPEGSRRARYRLTEKGRDLLPVILALKDWGDRHQFGPNHVPLPLPQVDSL